jgi:holo-[acyl-carrier protein] synthase
MLGIDVVTISRLRGALERSPQLEARLFSGAERTYCRSMPEPVRHFAGTLAAKEAVIKAIRAGRLVAWARRIEISRDAAGVPSVAIDGGVAPITVSISHDGDTAVAAALILPSRDSLLEMNRVASELVAKGRDQFAGE